MSVVNRFEVLCSCGKVKDVTEEVERQVQKERERILKGIDDYFEELCKENNLCVGFYDVECEQLKESFVSNEKKGVKSLNLKKNL